MSPQDQGPLPSASGCHLPPCAGKAFLFGGLVGFEGWLGSVPSPGGEGAELARRKGSMGSGGGMRPGRMQSMGSSGEWQSSMACGIMRENFV